MKLVLLLIFVISIILCFLPDFAFAIGNIVIPYYFIFLLLIIPLFIIYNPNLFFQKVLILLKSNTFRLLLFFIVWVFIGEFISFDKFSLPGVLRAIGGGLFLSVLIPYFITFLGIPFLMSYRKIIILILIMFYIIFSIGILDFIGNLFEIDFINKIIIILANKSSLFQLQDAGAIFNTNCHRVISYANGLPRISSIFSEPSVLGYFINISLPICLIIGFSNNKLLDNHLIDFLFKKGIMILIVLDLLLTQSPPAIIVFILIILSFLILQNYKIFLNLFSLATINFVVIVTSLSLLCFIYYGNIDRSDINLELGYLKRIESVFTNVNDLKGLIIAEPSFGARLLLALTYYDIFYSNPISGIGYGNLTKQIKQNLLNSNLPLTSELEDSLKNKDEIRGSNTILLRSLTETGIIGTVLLYSFFILLFLGILSPTIKKNKDIGIDIIVSLKFFILVLVATSIYDSNLHAPYIWILLGLAQSMIINSNNMNNIITNYNTL